MAQSYVFCYEEDIGLSTCLVHGLDGNALVNLAKANLTCDYRMAPGEPKCGKVIPSAVEEGIIEPGSGPAICSMGFAKQYGIPVE